MYTSAPAMRCCFYISRVAVSVHGHRTQQHIIQRCEALVSLIIVTVHERRWKKDSARTVGEREKALASVICLWLWRISADNEAKTTLSEADDFFPSLSFCWNFFGRDNCRCVPQQDIASPIFTSRSGNRVQTTERIYFLMILPHSHEPEINKAHRQWSGNLQPTNNQLFIPRIRTVPLFSSNYRGSPTCNEAALVFVVSGSFEARGQKIGFAMLCVGKGLVRLLPTSISPLIALVVRLLVISAFTFCEIDLSAPIRGSGR